MNSDCGTPGSRPNPGRRERAVARKADSLKARRRAETLDELLARLGIAADAWDWLLVGDGSGSNYRKATLWERMEGTKSWVPAGDS